MRNFYTKSLLTVLLSLCSAVVSAQSFESNGISYSILSLSDRTVEVAHNANYQGFIIIPSTTDYSGISFKVTGIGDGAFSRTNVTEMIISEGVTRIGDSAFYASTLKEIIIPNCVTSIGDYAFRDCTNLTSITIPNNITTIGSYTFYNCTSLTSVTIPDSVTTIGDYAFNGCTGLTSVTIGNGVTSIEEKAFYGCTKLKLIYNDSSLNLTIGSNEHGYVAYYAKFITTNKNDYTIVDDYIFNKTDGVYTLVSYIGSDIKISLPLNCNGINYAIGSSAFRDCTYLTSITIPNSVTSIGNDAFYGCSGLTSIEIPNSVTSIGSSAFYLCTGLTNVTIPNSVTSIGNNAFSICTSLTAIHITNLSAWCNIDFSNDLSNPLVYAKNLYINGEKVSSLVIPSGITEIKQYAFYNCTGLTSVTIPNSVTSIGPFAFRFCTGLTSITIPNGVTTIGNSAFDNCTGLARITIPNSVTSIRNNTFFNCNGLTSITIPNSVTYIGSSAFYLCTGLTSITIPNSVRTIGEYAFSGCSGLTSVTIPNSVTTIEEAAFSGCTGLTSIKVESGNTNYDSRDNCNAIIETATNTLIQGCKNTIIPNSVTTIEEGAFSGCTGLTSVTIPNSVRTIGEYAFSGCSGLTSVTIPNSVTTIEERAFSGCTGLTSVTIPNSVTTIEEAAFSGCTGLTEMYVKATTPPTIYYNWLVEHSDAFYMVPRSIPVYVPAGTKATYQATAWNEFFIVEMTITGDVDGDNIVDIADVTTLAEIILNGEETEDGATEQTFDAWTSTNSGVSNSTSQNSYTLEATEGSVLTFDWSVSSETNYDWLIITLDGTQILKKSGNVSGSYTHTFTTAGTHTLVVKYTKDGSRNSGNDYGGTYNIKLSGSANNKTNPAADVDGDGSIDVADITEVVNIILNPDSGDDDNSDDDNDDNSDNGNDDNSDNGNDDNTTVTPGTPSVTAGTAIDLGLSVKWASCNVGATAPEEYGGYYAWGETEEKSVYTWDTYKYCNGSNLSMTKYCTSSVYGIVDNKTTLEPTDDVASVKWGGSWRMPTLSEQQELRNSCTWTWTTLNGVNGYRVTGPNGNSIFLPAAGCRYGTEVGYRGSDGNYLSSSLFSLCSNDAYGLNFISGDYDWDGSNVRENGCTVRPVCP